MVDDRRRRLVYHSERPPPLRLARRSRGRPVWLTTDAKPKSVGVPPMSCRCQNRNENTSRHAGRGVDTLYTVRLETRLAARPKLSSRSQDQSFRSGLRPGFWSGLRYGGTNLVSAGFEAKYYWSLSWCWSGRFALV